MATIQVKTAINKLKKAGLRRDQFSVQVEHKYIGRYKGKAEYEYGDAKISLRDTMGSGLNNLNTRWGQAFKTFCHSRISGNPESG